MGRTTFDRDRVHAYNIRPFVKPDDMNEHKEYLTKEKFEELSKELEYLKKVRRKEVAEDLEYAKSLGDLSENAEYHEARELQGGIEDRVAKLEAMLKSAVIMAPRHSEEVGIGSTVVVKRDGDDKTHTFEVVGSEEVDVTKGKLSIRSPLGEAMVGKRKGQEFVFQSPKGEMRYSIVDVS